jgi:acetyl-CoA synthase
MSENFLRMAIEGAKTAIIAAEGFLKGAIRLKGAEATVSYPETGYFLPCIYALTGKDIKKLSEIPPMLDYAKSLVKDTPTVENALNAGLATLIAAEVIEASRYASLGKPYGTETLDGFPDMGFQSDVYMRKQGVGLVSHTLPGIAVIVGYAPSSEVAGKIGKELQERGILSFLVGPICEQMAQAGVKLGQEYGMVPLGRGLTAASHASTLAFRLPIVFGGYKPGKKDEILDYIKHRVPAFILQLGTLDNILMAAIMGVIAMGLTVTSDQEIPKIIDGFTSQPDYSKIVESACEVRNLTLYPENVIRLKRLEIPIPIAFGPAFEGKSIRKEQMYVEFGGGRSPAFELVRMKPMEEVQDGKIVVEGPEIDQMEEGNAYPLGIIVDIAGRKMEKDFEPVLERRIHEWINYGEETWHLGQRKINWIRISKEGFKKGFKIRHFGDILYVKYHTDFPAIAEKVQITLLTDRAKVEEALKEATQYYDARDARITGLTDEQVDTFYSCTLCQSFAAQHVCVITPERPSLCGAISWLDAKASYRIQPEGLNQPITPGKCLDPERGEWEGVNEFVYKASRNATKRVHLYSITSFPLTSCGCFECVAVVAFEVNGVIIINREYGGENPTGLPFSTLAGTIGGGVQTPGAMGVGRMYILSKKFIKPDGGIKRVVWMPKELKEALESGLRKRGEEEGVPDLYDKIADETVAKTMEELKAYLQKVKHPVLEMPPLTL